MPCVNTQKEAILSIFARIAPVNSALFRTRQNIPYAELGIMAIFISEARASHNNFWANPAQARTFLILIVWRHPSACKIVRLIEA